MGTRIIESAGNQRDSDQSRPEVFFSHSDQRSEIERDQLLRVLLQVLAHSEIPETHTIRIGPILRGAT